MIRYVNLDTLDVQASADFSQAIPKLPAKYLSALNLQLQFVSQGVVQLLQAGTTLLFGVKQANDFSGNYLASNAIWTTPGDPSGYYTGVISFATTEVQAALTQSPDPNADVPLDDAIGEILWVPGGSGTPIRSNTFTVEIANAVNRGNEGTIVDAPPAYPQPQNIPTIFNAITGLTGGGNTNLDGIVTAGVIAPLCVLLLGMSRPTPLFWQRVISPAVVSSSVANPTHITTATPHGLASGQNVTIGGHAGSTPNLNGNWVATVLDATHFTIPANVTVAGAGGFVTPATNTGAGIVRPADFDAAANAQFWQSAS